MCLSRQVGKVQPTDLCISGYKLVRQDEDRWDVAFGTAVKGPYLYDTWLNSESIEIVDEEGIPYTTGFHCFFRKEDAEALRVVLYQGSSLMTVPIRARQVFLLGKHKYIRRRYLVKRLPIEIDCFVAKQILVLRPKL